MKITRAAYMNHNITHRQYYGEVVRLAQIKLSPKFPLVQEAHGSHDEHYNDIPLQRWDYAAVDYQQEMIKAFKQVEDFYSMAGSVCVLKEAVRQTLERTYLDEFTKAYISCALSTSLDDNGQSLDRHFIMRPEPDRLSPETLQQVITDCAAFQKDNHIDLDNSGMPSEQQGHDFWLTRNRHGTGFWDRGIEPKSLALRLTDAAHAYGEVNLWVNTERQWIEHS